jgi:hypothetical protein
MNKNKKERLLDLENKIEYASSKAIDDMYIILTNVYDNVLYGERSKRGKIKEATLNDITTLLRFYLACTDAASNSNASKLKRLSHLELDTMVVEDFMDKKLRNLLIKYNEAAYGKI